MSKHDETMIVPPDDEDDPNQQPPPETPRRGVSETLVGLPAERETPRPKRGVSETMVVPSSSGKARSTSRPATGYTPPEDRIDERDEPRDRRPIFLIVVPIVALVLCGIIAAIFLAVRNLPSAEDAATSTPGSTTPQQASTTLALPPAPSNLRAVVIAIYDIPVGWADNSTNEEGFRVYRARVDQSPDKVLAGSVGQDATQFVDQEATCGATYEYTVASYNTAGESPATECWQITVPPCPEVKTVQLRSGMENGVNFLTGASGIDADFYWTNGTPPMLRADQPGQKGFIVVGDTGSTPLYDVAVPEERNFVESAELQAGTTYLGFARDGLSVIVFRVASIADPLALEVMLWTPGHEIIGQCGQVVSTPSADTTPTSGGGASCRNRRGDGVCCVQAGENHDNSTDDCPCVDNGVCSTSAGETGACCDCDPNCGGACGRACSDSSQCSAGLACAGGVCWDACRCGGDCGGGERQPGITPNNPSVTPCTPSGYSCECVGYDWVCTDTCGVVIYVDPGYCYIP